MPAITPTVLSSAAMKGGHVTGSRGEDLGRIKEVMIDLSAGRVAYAVMSFGGFLGIGARMVAIPWDALRASPHTDEYVADVSKDLLKKAPSFGNDKWPSGDDRSFLSALYAHYGCAPYWSPEEGQAAPELPGEQCGASSADLTGGADDLNFLGSTLRLVDEDFGVTENPDPPKEGNRRGGNSSGDLCGNEEDLSEDEGNR